MTDAADAPLIPSILEINPRASLTLKSFHGRRIQVWEGLANVTRINGWVDNPRLDLELKRFKNKNAGRGPNNKEILNIMVTVREFNIKTLADDIRDNGVRQPIIISKDGRLLDGNRRYFATLYLVSTTPADDPNLQDYIKVPVWVLHESNPEDETRILVQENFYSSLKVEWGDYVKANRIYNDLQDGLSVVAVSQKYGWGKPKVNETKKIMELIDEFKNFVTQPEPEGLGMEELDAEQIAAEKYQFFNEAQKSFYASLSTNYDFKTQFFRQIANNTFSSFQEVRIAWDAWQDVQAKEILASGTPGAAKKAKALLDYKNFHSTGLSKAEDTIEGFVKFLSQLTAAQMTALTPESLKQLAECLQRVIDMANAAKTGNGAE
jgi:hypothetical protein